MKSIARLPICVLSLIPGVPANSALAEITLKARRVGILLAAFSMAFGLAAKAQTAHLSGYQLTTNINPTPASGYSPYAVAVDGSGNVFTVGISSNDSRQVTEWSPSGGTYTSMVVVSNLPDVVQDFFGIAVDQSDNLYVGTATALVKETLSGGSYVQSVIASLSPNNYGFAVAVDLNGNVYVAGIVPSGAGITRYTASGGGYQASSISVPPPIAGCLVAIDGPIAVDAAGNIYLGTNLHNGSCDGGKYLIEESPSLGGYTQTQATEVQQSYYLDGFVITDPNGKVYTIATPTMLAAVQYASGSAVDASGNIYTTGGTAQGFIWKSTPYAAPSSGGNFGEVAVGSTSNNISFGSSSSGGPHIAALQSIAVSSIFTFDSPGTLGGIVVATGGGPYGSDFANVSGSCNHYTTYAAAAGQTCIVDLVFSPATAGSRFGAVYLADSSHNVLATGYVQGTGIAPDAVLYPGTESVLSNAASYGLSQPSGMAVDGVGNIFIADPANNQVVAQTYVTQTQVTVANGPSNGLSAPAAVAVDGSGSVLIADTGNNRVLKETLYQTNGLCVRYGCAPHTYTQSVVAEGLSQPEGVAVDGAGFIYIADTGNNRILLETPVASGYTQSVLISNGLSTPTGITVDGGGNLYIANAGSGELLKETLSGASYTQSTVASGLNEPAGVSIDPAGNVYVADAGNNQVLMEQLNGSSYTQTVIASGLNTPQAIVVNPHAFRSDQGSAVYIADTGNQQVIQLDLLNQQTLHFANTPVGGASATQTLTLVNIGNAPLQLTVPATGSNPSLVTDYGNTASAFTLSSGGDGDCPVVSAGASEAPTLAAGASCQMLASFTPNALDPGFGNAEGDTVSILDNSLNSEYANPPTQAVQFIGTAETAVGTTTTLGSALNPSFTGQTVTFTATVSPASGVTVPSGTVQFSVDGGTVGSPVTLRSGQATYATSALTVATHSITAVYTPATGTAFASSSATALSQVVSQVIPTVSVAPSLTSITTLQSLSVLVNVASTPVPTGSVVLNGGGYTSAVTVLSAGNATITIPAGSLATGSDTLTAIFTPDSNSSSIYTGATGTTSVTVTSTAAMTSPAPGSTLTSASTTFTWNAGAGGVTGYYLWVGTSPGTNNLAQIGLLSGTSTTVTLPINGATIYVRLWTVTNGTTYLYNDYTYTEFTQSAAVMTVPSPNSTLTSASTTFTWNAGSGGVTGYYLWVGTSAGTNNLAQIGLLSGTSTTVTLPINGATIYVRLWTVTNGTTYLYNDYTYTEFTQSAAVMASPSDGSTLTSASTTFTWNAGTGGVTGYYLWVGTSAGTNNLAQIGLLTGTSTTVTLPINGATIYVRLWTVINGTTYLYKDYTYTEFTQSAATMASPSPNSTLTSASTTFTWNAGSGGVTGYYLWVGTSAGTNNLTQIGLLLGTSTTVTLPTNGATIYVRLWTVINGTIYLYNDYTYTEFRQAATMSSPSPGSTLTAASTTFTWGAGTGGVTGYYLWVGTSAGANNLAQIGLLSGTGTTVTLPSNGATIYARLWTVINGTTYLYNDYTYTEFTQSAAVMASPTPGGTLASASTTFTWNAGAGGVTGYYVWVGSSAGTNNLAQIGLLSGTSTTVTLPTNGAAIYVRLWTVINGTIYIYNDYTYTEAP